jgi:hypothetical protein
MTHSLLELNRPTADPIGLGNAPVSVIHVSPPSKETWIWFLASA